MDVVRWEAPPPHGNTGKRRPGPKAERYQAVADALRANPGEWAVVTENRLQGTAASLVWRIRNGLGSWGPAGSFDARTSGTGSSSKVYARYVGGAL